MGCLGPQEEGAPCKSRQHGPGGQNGRDSPLAATCASRVGASFPRRIARTLSRIGIGSCSWIIKALGEGHGTWTWNRGREKERKAEKPRVDPNKPHQRWLLASLQMREVDIPKVGWSIAEHYSISGVLLLLKCQVADEQNAGCWRLLAWGRLEEVVRT